MGTKRRRRIRVLTMDSQFDKYGKCQTCMKAPSHILQCRTDFGTCRYFYYDLGNNTEELYEAKETSEKNYKKKG